LLKIDSEQTQNDGLINTDNNVIGSYLHGLFDTPEAANALLRWAGLKQSNAPDLDQIRERQLDRLASCLEETLDLESIFGSETAHALRSTKTQARQA